MSNVIDKEGLIEECELAFNSALQRAHNQYPYRWARINQAKEEIVALIELPRQKSSQNGEIKKPQVTEEWIKEKAEELKIALFDWKVTPQPKGWHVGVIKNFIRSLVEEIGGKD